MLSDVNVDILGQVDEIPELGGCEFGDSPEVRLGGSGLNTYLATRKLDIEATIISKVGNDFFGSYLINKLKQKSLDTSWLLRSDDFPTGVVFTALTKGERSFFSFRKNAADLHIKWEEVNSLDADPEAVFVAGPPLLQGFETVSSFNKVTRSMRGKGSKVFFDPNLRRESAEVFSRVNKILAATDIFLPNKKELQTILNKSNKFDSIKDLFEIGVKQIWVKNGSGGSELFLPNRHLKFPPISIKPVDTSGAGDSYNGVIIWGLLRDKNLKEIGLLANIYAGVSTNTRGGPETFPNLAELNQSKYYTKLKNEVEEQ